MNTLDIIATVGARRSNIKDLLPIIQCGITKLRFNFSKFSERDEKRIFMIKDIKKEFGNEITVLIDIPFPGEKSRIYNNCESLSIFKDEPYILVSNNKSNNNVFFTTLKYIGRKLKIGDEIIYSDGDGVFEVIEVIDDNTIIFISHNDVTIVSGKSITLKNLGFQYRTQINSKYVNIIKETNADEVALSFVENDNDVKRFKKVLEENHCSSKIFSKIETKRGIENIDRICQISNIIVGRGDLSINSNINYIYYNQKYLVEKSKEYYRDTYIATGLLNSLLKQENPSVSDIVDLTTVLLLMPNGIVLNSPIIYSNLEKALYTIKEVKYAVDNKER